MIGLIPDPSTARPRCRRPAGSGSVLSAVITMVVAICCCGDDRESAAGCA